ncbi:MAG: hypothetical protein Kow0029_18480 [Candidatus Rifleibacteriota bacterium]
MKFQKIFSMLAILLIFIACVRVADCAEIDIPSSYKPGDLFIVRVVSKSEDNKITIESESGAVQFMGAVQGTPDIQMLSDHEVMIEPKGAAGKIYELKYLPMSNKGRIGFKISDINGVRSFFAALQKNNNSRNYSWLILAGAVLLIIVGIKLWKFQKSAPAMMSTKSLFMNYEELEKARKMYFGDNESKETETAQKTNGLNLAGAPEQNPGEEKSQKKTGERISSTDLNGLTTEEKLKNQSSISAEFMKKEETTESLNQSKAQAGETSVRDSQKTSQRPRVVSKLQKIEEKVTDGSFERLRIILKDPDGKSFSAEGETVKIGRRRENNIVLSNAEVSREHVMVYPENGKIWVRALTESNITQINGKNIKSEMQLKSGDILNLGGTEFKIELAETFRD